MLSNALKSDVTFSGWGANGITLVVDKIITYLISKWTSSNSDETDLDEENMGMKLKLILLKIRPVLSVAMETGVSRQWLLFWLNQIEDGTYNIEDLIDALKMDSTGKLKHMKEQIGRMHDLINGNYSEAIKELERERSFHPKETSSIIGTQSCILDIQRRAIVDGIINRAVQLKPTDSLMVQSIVGGCGIGKTTVARHVYNSYNIRGHFEHRVWISMSKSFNLDSVLKSFMESATKETFDSLGSDANEVRFQNYIRGKKFFLVLDGVWQENRSDWSSFFELLEVQSNGCAVLVTTQSIIGAAVVGSKHTYELSTLLEEDLMAIFEANAFKLSQERSSDYPDLMKIGKEIVSSCYGNPMFVKTFGEVLLDKRTKKEWQLVQDTNISELPRNESSISEALRLCYYRLPTHLKACLSYCALFSKSFEFEKDFLTKLWLAEDLIQSKVNIRIEDSADLCFEELVKRSYFQISGQQQGTTRKYKLQGLVYEMLKIVGTNNPLKARVDSRRSLLQQSKYLRYLSLDYHDSAEAVDMNDLVAFKKLRTIILMRQVPFAGFCDDFFEKLEFIRVLDLSRSGITALPSSIKDCKYLKYLDVSGSEIASIDAGICNLIWLETLKIKNCKHLKELPEDFSNLVNIRDLEMDEESLVHTPVHIRRLTQLRELKKFVIRNLNGCRIAELVEMNQLEGSLCIEGVEHASDVEEDEAQPERYLDRKDHVQKLKLNVKDQAVPIGTAKLGFELSHPSPKLAELIVEGYIWDSLWEWDWRSLALETVDLIGCSNLTSIRGLRELPRLKRLKLSGFNVIYLDSSFFGQDDDVGFSLLDTLTLDSWNQWETWDGVGKYMLKIVRLCIQNCPAFHTLPDLSEWHSLNFLHLKSCNSLQNCLGSPPPDINFPTVENCSALGENAWPLQVVQRN